MIETLLALFVGQAWAWTLIGPNIEGWAGRTIAVRVNPADCTLGETELYEQVDRALAVWNGVPTSRLTLVRSAEPTALTVDDYEGGGGAGELPAIVCDPDFGTNIGDADVVPAATLVTTGAGPLTRSIIVLNAESGAGAEISNLDPDQFRITLAHELGHMLGLGHSSAPESLMYYSISGKATARLTEDDMQGITYLYPRNELAAGTFGCAAARGRGNPWGLGVALLYLVSLLGVGRVLVRSGPLP